MSKIDLQELVRGSSKELDINSQTVQAICHEYVNKRIQFKKRKLRWRVSQGSQRSLGWVPFNGQTIKVAGNKVRYNGQDYKFWNTREMPNHPKCGSFSQDSQGYWYVNFVVEAPVVETRHSVEDIGGDLGLKETAVFSDGTRIENQQIFRQQEAKLGGFQRHHKKKQARKLAARIKNIRLDFAHKMTLKLVKKYQILFIGNVSGKFLQATNGKSSQDASIGMFRQILSYKAVRHQGRVVNVSEFASTITCSNCFEKNGPSGLIDLGVREWTCNQCHAHHDRDINAARNILRVGRDSLRAVKSA